jgi:hypothetical protein
MKKFIAASILVLVYGGALVGTFLWMGPRNAAIFWGVLLGIFVPFSFILGWAFYTLRTK